MFERLKNLISASPKANISGTSNLTEKKHTQKYPNHIPHWAILGNVDEGKIHQREHDTRDTLDEQIDSKSALKQS